MVLLYRQTVAWETSGVIVATEMLLYRLTLAWETSGFIVATERCEAQFCLGKGSYVWGYSYIIGKKEEEFPEREFSSKDWGYLIVLYLLLHVIRFGFFVCAFPVVSKIGLGSNWMRAGYQKQMDDGELVDREFVVLALTESLELAAKSVERANRLNDWDYVFLVRYPSVDLLKFAQGHAGRYCCCDKVVGCCGMSHILDADTIRVRLDTEKCLAFIRAHTTAQETIQKYFINDKHLEMVEEKIIQESGPGWPWPKLTCCSLTRAMWNSPCRTRSARFCSTTRSGILRVWWKMVF